MSWSTFTATYAPNAGPLRLGHWECADTERPATRLGPQPELPGHARRSAIASRPRPPPRPARSPR